MGQLSVNPSTAVEFSVALQVRGVAVQQRHRPERESKLELEKYAEIPFTRKRKEICRYNMGSTRLVLITRIHNQISLQVAS